MGKKDKKKGKGAEKSTFKTEKKLSSKLKKELALKGEEDIETVLAKFVEEDTRKNSIIEESVVAPSKRSSFSLTPHPDKDQLILFGGEYFNGIKTFMYNDLHFYNIKNNKWIKITSPGGPPPRSAHQAVSLSQDGGQLWIFGGEYTSPSQSQFYHYKDLWVFSFNTKKWQKILGTGNGPSSRSGHRMVALKKQLFIFGGFHDNLRDYKYFNDVYSFNLETYSWKRIEPSGIGPCARSGCQILPTSEGKILVYGGYSKERVKKDIDKGIIHSDMFLLAPDKHDTTGLKWKWQSAKQQGMKPSIRCAFSMALIAADRAAFFGGVFDSNDDDEELEGIFYNDLYTLDLIKNTWHRVSLSGKKEDREEKKRRRKNKDNVEQMEDDDQVSDTESELETHDKQTSNEDEVFKVTIGSSIEGSLTEASASDKLYNESFWPPPRMNSGLAVKKGVLYVYGGIFEEGDKQLTLNDFYSLDLNKVDQWRTIIPLNSSDLEWFESDSEDSNSDSTSEESEDEEMEIG